MSRTLLAICICANATAPASRELAIAVSKQFGIINGNQIHRGSIGNTISRSDRPRGIVVSATDPDDDFIRPGRERLRRSETRRDSHLPASASSSLCAEKRGDG